MHPLQLLALLHGHYRRLLALDDPAVRSSQDAAAALGGRANPRSAGFRLRQARALGSGGLQRAFDLLAQADLDLKGARAIPEDAVVELLVARLAGLTPGARRAPTSPAPFAARFMSREVRRAAWRGWIRPFAPALARRCWA